MSVVKCLIAVDNQVKMMFRNPPISKHESLDLGIFKKVLGLFAFRKDALLFVSRIGEMPFETLESIETIGSWVNFMKAGEFNPPHMHLNCDFTCVIYLDIPKELIHENKEYIGTLAGKGGPGAISFRTNIYNEKYNTCRIDHFPERGDFFIFPGSLEHFVYPFKSNCERISVSANFNFKIKESL